MALQAFPFSFFKTAGPTTGAQTIVPGGGSGIPFNPKAFWFYSAGGITSGVFTTVPTDYVRRQMFGMAVPPGVGSRTGFGANPFDGMVISYVVDNFDSVSYAAWNNTCLAFLTPNVVLSKGTLSAINTLGGGFFGIDINWTVNDAADPARLIHGVAFGGDDVDVVLYLWGQTSGNGSTTHPGVGQQSDVVLTMGMSGMGQGGGSESGVGGPVSIGLSAMNCALEHVGVAIIAWDESGRQRGGREHSLVGHPVLEKRGVPSIPAHLALNTITEMTTDGWVISTTSPNPTASGHGNVSLCFRGVSSKIGSFIKPASTTGTQTVSAPGVTPVYAWLFGDNNTAVTDVQLIDRLASGSAISGSEAGIAGTTIYDGALEANDVRTAIGFSDKAYAVVNNDTPAVQARIDSVGFAANEITPDWDINDSELTEILMCVLGEGSHGKCGGGSFAGTWVDNIMVHTVG